MTKASKRGKTKEPDEGVIEATIPCDMCKKVAAKLRFVPKANRDESEPRLGRTVGRLSWNGPWSEGSSPVQHWQENALRLALLHQSAQELHDISSRFGMAYCPNCERTLCGKHVDVHWYDGDVEALCLCGEPRPVGGESLGIEELYHQMLVNDGRDPLPGRKKRLADVRERNRAARAKRAKGS